MCIPTLLPTGTESCFMDPIFAKTRNTKHGPADPRIRSGKFDKFDKFGALHKFARVGRVRRKNVRTFEANSGSVCFVKFHTRANYGSVRMEKNVPGIVLRSHVHAWKLCMHSGCLSSIIRAAGFLDTRSRSATHLELSTPEL